MNCTVQELREEWLQALESGEFTQTDECLQDNTGYCCLGVAGVIAGRHEILVLETDDGLLEGSTLEDQLEVQKGFGFDTADGGYVEYKNEPKSLTVLNDDHVPFVTIAQLVREQWLTPGGIWYEPKKTA